MKPKVSVLLPAHNAGRYLVEAMESILAQTYRSFELLVVDDGSKDSTPTILKQMAKKDPRVRWWRLPKNRGRSFGLNFLISKAKGEFLARMDGDDVAVPERFALQMAKLEADPGLGVLSSAMWLWDGGSKRVYSPSPGDHESIKVAMAFQNSVSHPALMMRRKALGKHRYLVGFETEDYELWCRMLPTVRFENLPAPLIHYRVHLTQSGSGRPMEQFRSASEVRLRYLDALGFKVSPEAGRYHNAVCRPFLQRRRDWIPGVKAWLLELKRQNQQLQCLDPEVLMAWSRERFGHYCSGLGIAGTADYLMSGGTLRGARALNKENARAFLKHHLKPEKGRWE